MPSLSIENAYENIYMLREYAPIIMHPWRLGVMDNHSPIYYSLAHPTMPEGTSMIRHALSVISEIQDIKMLMNMLKKTLAKHCDANYMLIKDISFEYFHTEKDKFQEISDSKNLTRGDDNLISCIKRFKNKIFPYQGPFFRGCIRITNKTKKIP